MGLRLTCFALLISFFSWAQVTTDPAEPIANLPVTITVDVTGTQLQGYTSDVWIWTWIEKSTGDINAPTNVSPATEAQSAALMTRSTTNSNLYSITFTPTEFFNQPADIFDEIGILLKGRDWNNKTPDYSFAVISGVFEVDFTSPLTDVLIVEGGELIEIIAIASEYSSITLMVDDLVVASVQNAIQLNHLLIADDSGSHIVKVLADNGEDQGLDSFNYTIRSNSIQESRPLGIITGINYHDDATKATLCLLAPLKSSVYVTGDFNDWNLEQEYQMKQDGEYFWLEISGLTPGEEYGYQYLVDESIWIADPFAEKILDPDDKEISDSVYPNLKEYPIRAYHNNWYENRVAVLQTNQEKYVWLHDSFEKPDKENLIIYELLLRDFLGEENMSYQALIDTLDYLEDLGINAIELMPIMEFNSNNSWGYNPTFMFAVDKLYGDKDDLKDLIDECHRRGIVVLLDMVMNQNDIPSPYAIMYFDHLLGKPKQDNPWFNRDARHPFNVFFDINHESEYTKAWLDTVNHYWLNEFHFDGYRFDLSKGFTQKYSTDDGVMRVKDDSRIAILKRMATEIWSHTPDAYVILEHFADNQEEKILSDFGMMLWAQGSHDDYSEANMGYTEGKTIGNTYYANRGWTKNHLVAYMESHDEERQMNKMYMYGNAGFGYSTQMQNVALQRLKMTATFFFLTPGPKMLWQWGEFGYDISIEVNGRTGRKPPHWEYLEDSKHKNVQSVYKELIALRNKYDLFKDGDFSWQPNGNFKSIHITKADTNVVVIGNFDVTAGSPNPEFQHTGIWYDFFSGYEIEVSNATEPIQLNAGEFHIYTDKRLHQPDYDIITGIEEEIHAATGISVYPNPTNHWLHLSSTLESPTGQLSWKVVDLLGKTQLQGASKKLNQLSIDVSLLTNGLYTIEVSNGRTSQLSRFITE